MLRRLVVWAFLPILVFVSPLEHGLITCGLPLFTFQAFHFFLLVKHSIRAHVFSSCLPRVLLFTLPLRSMLLSPVCYSHSPLHDVLLPSDCFLTFVLLARSTLCSLSPVCFCSPALHISLSCLCSYFSHRPPCCFHLRCPCCFPHPLFLLNDFALPFFLIHQSNLDQ